MNEISLADINGIASSVDLSILSTVGDPQTKALLLEILERLVALEGEYRDFREETALERAHDRKRIADLEDLVEREGLEAARARQRITALETPAPPLREETASAHLDRLFSEMRRLNLRQVRMKDAARILEISVPQMKNVKPHIGDDPRFVIVKDPSHKQRHLIRLI
jgi:hypothetical protein